MEKTLGIIGAGMIGETLARLAIAGGASVVIANSRGPASLRETLDGLGPRARAVRVEDFAGLDVVVVAVPLAVVPTIAPRALGGAVVVDANNYYPERDGFIPELDSRELTSTQWVQRHFADSQVVKAFNSIGYRQLGALARRGGSADRTALPIAGDDEPAKDRAREWMDLIGYDAVDIGGLEASWRSEPGTEVYCAPYQATASPRGLSPAQWRSWSEAQVAVSVSAEQLRDILMNTRRAQPGGKVPFSLG